MEELVFPKGATPEPTSKTAAIGMKMVLEEALTKGLAKIFSKLEQEDINDSDI